MAEEDKPETPAEEAQEEVKVSKASKKGRKLWLPIIAPKLFSNQLLGKSYVLNAEQLMDKPVKVNLMNLTGDMKNQNINMGFRVMGIKNNEGLAEVWSYELMPAHIKKMARRKRDKLDDSFVLETKEKLKLIVKPMLLTNTQTTNSVKRDLRKNLRNLMIRMFKSLDYEDIIRNIIIRKIQNSLKKELNLVTPIRACEIKVLERISDKAVVRYKVLELTKEPKKTKEEVEEAAAAEEQAKKELKNAESAAEKPAEQA